MATTLLPTSDGSGGRFSAEVGGTRPSGAKRAVTLATAVAHEVKPGLCPACRAALDEGLAAWQCPNPNRCGAGEPSDLLPTPTASDRNGGKVKARGAMLNSLPYLLPTPTVANGTGGNLTRGGERSGEVLLPGAAVGADTPHGTDWGKYTAAVARWEGLTRPAPEPTVSGRNGKPVLNPRLSEWMMGLPEGHVTDHPGLPRSQALKIIGNGVVPQQAAAALVDLLDGWI